MNNATANFAKRLKDLRTSAGLNQDELAKKIGISRGAVSYYENGDRVPDINVLFDIAEFFNVTSDFLIGRSTNSTTALDIQEICKKTGLSDKAIENIAKINLASVDKDANLRTDLLRGIDYLFSQAMSIDIIEGLEPDENYWKVTDGKEPQGTLSVSRNGEAMTFMFYGKGIQFLRNLNDMLFNNYVDFNPYAPIGHSGNIVSVVNRANSPYPKDTFALLDDTGSAHFFDFTIITKALLLEINEILSQIRDTIKHENSKEFIITFDNDNDNWHEIEMKRLFPTSIDETEKL